MADWGFCEGIQQTDTYGDVTASSTGTTLSSPGSANVKGAFTQLTASTTRDGVGLMVSGAIVGSSIISISVDIAVGSAGSEQIIIPDIVAVRLSSTNTVITPFFIPISIAAGSRISARYQSDVAGQTVQLSVVVLSATSGYPILASKVNNYGFNSATSKGISVDPGGTANTKGAFTELVSQTPSRTKWALIAALPDSASTTFNWLLDIAIGSAGSEQVILRNMQISSAANVGTALCRFFIPLEIPQGVRVSARLSCSSTGAGRALNVNILGAG